MELTLEQIDKEADRIKEKCQSGELMDGCSMSAIQTPAREAWDVAHELIENNMMTALQRKEVFSSLDKNIRSQLDDYRYNNFDLVYERLLQLIGT
ncbi:MAG TPA: hypothetical protein ENJ87_04640 [Gammaproteobacteria bacterium]|nr:hypothetical protein [Gammaproteobacteria bacterium]